jgi:hypothetical protein
MIEKRKDIELRDASKHAVTLNSTAKDDAIYCATMDLVWNHMNDTIDIKKWGDDYKIVKALNRREFDKSMLDEDSYTLTSEVSANTIEIISKLEKNFKFHKPFEMFKKGKFAGRYDVQYFGKSADTERDDISMIFYEDKNNHGIKIDTRDNEEIYLYKTSKRDTFKNLWKEIKVKESRNIFFKKLNKDDIFKMPLIKLNVYRNIEELRELKFKSYNNGNYLILKAGQKIDFKLDNEGGELRSLAYIGILSAAESNKYHPKKFYYDKDFIMFIKQKNSNKPYFAIRINSDKYLDN